METAATIATITSRRIISFFNINSFSTASDCNPIQLPDPAGNVQPGEAVFGQDSWVDRFDQIIGYPALDGRLRFPLLAGTTDSGKGGDGKLAPGGQVDGITGYFRIKLHCSPRCIALRQ